jgi:hypothetical protein
MATHRTAVIIATGAALGVTLFLTYRRRRSTPRPHKLTFMERQQLAAAAALDSRRPDAPPEMKMAEGDLGPVPTLMAQPVTRVASRLPARVVTRANQRWEANYDAPPEEASEPVVARKLSARRLSWSDMPLCERSDPLASHEASIPENDERQPRRSNGRSPPMRRLPDRRSPSERRMATKSADMQCDAASLDAQFDAPNGVAAEDAPSSDAQQEPSPGSGAGGASPHAGPMAAAPSSPLLDASLGAGCGDSVRPSVEWQ